MNHTKFNTRGRKVVPKRRTRVPQHKTITLYDYLASSVPAKVFDVINAKNTYRQPQSQRELTNQLKDFVKKNGESALIDLAKIHPDKDLINSDCDKCKSAELDKKVEIKEPKEIKETQIVYSNFNGETKSNTDGKEMIDKIKTINTNMVILGAFVLLGVAYLVKK